MLQSFAANGIIGTAATSTSDSFRAASLLPPTDAEVSSEQTNIPPVAVEQAQLCSKSAAQTTPHRLCLEAAGRIRAKSDQRRERVTVRFATADNATLHAMAFEIPRYRHGAHVRFH